MLSSRNTTNRITAIQTDNGIITESKTIANYFADKWSKCSSDINFPAEFIFAKNNFTSTIINATNKESNIIEESINVSELVIVINRVKGSTPGFDRISYEMIKNLTKASKQVLLKHYNNILEKGIIPHSWKTAIITCIPKTNKNHSDFSGYRLISLISCLSKLLERIIAKRISWYIETKKLVATNQVAFKTSRGCADSLMHLDHYISKTLSSRNHTSILGIDFEKAFDRIGIHIILDTLKSWGIGPKNFNYVKSF